MVVLSHIIITSNCYYHHINHDRCVKLLYKYESNLKVKTSQDDTSLHIAARHGYLDILKYLLNQGADKEARYLQYCIPE